jgi:hypothetical protein
MTDSIGKEQNQAGEDKTTEFPAEDASLKGIKDRVLGFYKEIKGYTPESLNSVSPEELYRSYVELDDIVHQEIDDRLVNTMLTDPDVCIALPVIRSYYARLIGIFEKHLARRLITADDPWSTLESFPLYSRYEVLVRDHGKASELSETNTLIFIGCGSVPISQILYKRFFGLRSIGLDIDSEAVSLARRCIRCLGLERDISIVHGYESRLVELQWDLIVVAALAEPKPRIFQNLYAIMKKRGKTPLSCRTYRGIRELLYYPLQPDDIIGFSIIREIAPRKRVNNTLILLEMK